MRRFYITKKEIWEAEYDFGGIMLPKYNLFHSTGGSHWLPLRDGLILISASFDVPENEGIWHSQFGVAKLPHPIMEADIPIHHLHSKFADWHHKDYREHHHEALKSVFPLEDHHTVWHLNDMTVKVHPLVRLDSRY